MTYQKTKGRWIDAGIFDSLLEANVFMAKKGDKLSQFQL
jgi:dTDP-glucose pyrophosphorylase